MDIKLILQAVSGLLFVIALIILTVIFIRWIRQHDSLKRLLVSSKRLSICDRVALDAKRSVVIIKSDQKEYLILLGSSNEVVLSSQESPEK